MFKLLKPLLALALFLLVAACSTGVKLDDANGVAEVNAIGSSGYDPISDPRSSVYGKRSIYFEFDSYAVDPKYASTISAHAAYLKAFQKQRASVIIQGNTDDRGTAEYNLALGQKRADAVVRALKVYGVKDSQMESISFGREKPKATGHDEASWSQNRRVDLEYPNK